MLKNINLNTNLIILAFFATTSLAVAKPNAEEALSLLKAGNERFVAGKSQYPHTGKDRVELCGKENQKDHAFATVLSCSDSRVAPEYLFDAGVMDIFVARVAGNVCNTDEAGCIEYGLAHVNTPLLVVLGHSQCGAVTAVTQAMSGHGHALERNIPPLVGSIEPAVKRAKESNPGIEEKELVNAAIEENVWQSMENLFVMSPRTRELVKEGKVKVVGAIYDVGTGEVKWLPEEKSTAILRRAEVNPKRAFSAMAQEKAHSDGH